MSGTAVGKLRRKKKVLNKYGKFYDKIRAVIGNHYSGITA